MRYRSNNTRTKLIIILILVLVVIGAFKGTDIIVSSISTIITAFMPCVIALGGLYILIRSLFR